MTTLLQKELYTTAALAKRLDVRVDWLRKNRKSQNPIPYQRIGRRQIRYHKEEVLKWLGRSDLPLQFYSSKKLIQMLSVSDRWLRLNRQSTNPIPFRRLDQLIRYNDKELKLWLKKHNFRHNASA